jgi:hypothetical protein
LLRLGSSPAINHRSASSLFSECAVRRARLC